MSDKELHRSEHNRIIAGVCGGYAEYFQTDPWLVRIIFMLLVAFGGSGILLYLISWFMIPEQNSQNSMDERKKFIHEMHTHMHKNNRTGHKLVGLILVFVGILLLLNNIFPDLGFDRLWPILLIIFGGVIMLGREHYEHEVHHNEHHEHPTNNPEQK